MGGIVSKKTLRWLGAQVISEKIDAKVAAKLILSQDRPFNAKVFSKMKKAEDFMKALDELGVNL